MEDHVDQRLKKLIAKLVLTFNYWGYLFSRIRRKPATNFGSIMGVAPEADGTLSLLYDIDLVEKTDDANILKVLEHEGGHLLNKHIPRLLRLVTDEQNERMKGLKIKIWNIAADCCVNVQSNIREPLIINKTPFPPQLPALYGLEEGKISEDYYITLLKRARKNQKEVEKMLNEMLKKKGGFHDHESWTKGEGLKGVCDVHALSRQIDQYVQNVIHESLKSFSKERGNMPAYIADLIKSALEPPKLPYYQIIRKLVRGTRFSKFKHSPTKINRKRTYSFVLEGDDLLPEISPFPGKTRDMTFDIVVLIDTSGSMSQDDIKDGLSGVKSIIEKDRHCYTTVLEVDAGVEKEYTVKHVRDIQFNIKGRGGTTLRPGLERARELGCDVCLAFTDGYTEDINSIPVKALPKKLIWVIASKGTSNNVNKTGYVVHI